MSSTMAMWDVALPFCEVVAQVRCNRCGRKIRTPAPNQRYCSELCRKRAERARWKKDGIDRAAIVLMYAISAQLGYMTKKELYDFFGDKKAAMEWLTEMKIDSNAKIIYDNPLEYFHYSLPFEMQDAFLFHNAYYNQQYNRFSKKIKKKKNK